MIPLNERELQYARLACEGLTHEEIAERMFKSVFTIRNYRDNVRDKTGSRSTVEAIAKLYDLGILKPKSSYETIRTRSLCPQAMEGDAGPVEKSKL